MRAAAGALAALAVAACSAAQDAGAPPPTPDEQRAVAEADAMIPPSERPLPEPLPQGPAPGLEPIASGTPPA